MLEGRGLRKRYASGKVTLEVLKGIDIVIGASDFVAITGPSGAGKSTLLHLLAGLDAPSEGEVLWEGKPMQRMRASERAAWRNGSLGIVFQAYHLVPELNALENVMLPAMIRKGRGDRALRERAAACLAQVGLEARLAHKPNALSGGELQRAAIARALMNEPRVLLCDEPTGNLDSKTGDEIIRLLKALHREKGMSLVLVTHQESLAAEAARHVRIRDGQIVQSLTPAGETVDERIV